MAELNESLAVAVAEANETFGKLMATVDERVQQGVTELDVAEVARRAGLDLDVQALDELQVDRMCFVHPFIPIHVYFPWRPLWCWWWRRRFPWFRCCPWWWHRCYYHGY